MCQGPDGLVDLLELRGGELTGVVIARGITPEQVRDYVPSNITVTSQTDDPRCAAVPPPPPPPPPPPTEECPPGELRQPDGTCGVGPPPTWEAVLMCQGPDGLVDLLELSGGEITGVVIATGITPEQVRDYVPTNITVTSVTDDPRCGEVLPPPPPPTEECPLGEELQADGTCAVIVIPPPPPPPPPPTCPPGQIVQTDGSCAPPTVVCPEGQTRQADGTCAPIPPPPPPPPPTGCPPGQELQPDGSCSVPTIVCPEGQELQEDGTCSAPTVVCPEGMTLQPDGSCSFSPVECPTGQELQPDGTCAPIPVEPPVEEEEALACPTNGTFDLYDAITGEHVASDVAEEDLPGGTEIIAADDPRCGLPPDVIPPDGTPPVDGGVLPPPDGGVPGLPPVDDGVPGVPPPPGGFPGTGPTGGPFVSPETGYHPTSSPTEGFPKRFPITNGAPIQFGPEEPAMPVRFPCGAGAGLMPSVRLLRTVTHEQTGPQSFANPIYRTF